MKTRHPKIAFLFLTMGEVTQPAVWNAFFADAERHRWSLYVHAKWPEQVQQPIFRDALLPETVSTEWGGISLVRATNLLLRYALEERTNERFVLVSDSTIPLVCFNQAAKRLLSTSRSFISYGFLHQSNAKQQSVFYSRHQALDPGVVPLESFPKQQQWMVLSRRLAEAAVEEDKTAMFEKMSCADEHYYILYFLQRGLAEEIQNEALTFADWRDLSGSGVRPKTYERLSPGLIRRLRGRGFLFMRKISVDCAVPLQTILSAAKVPGEDRNAPLSKPKRR